MRRGRTFIISGPSGVGKSTVLHALMEKRKNVYFSVSATTRDPRPGEIDGVHYHFLDVDTFRSWIAKDEFLEYAEYVGNFYGTPKKYVDAAMNEGKDVILDIEVQGAIQVTSKRPDTVRIFIAPPSWSELERRLTERGTDTEAVSYTHLDVYKRQAERSGALPNWRRRACGPFPASMSGPRRISRLRPAWSPSPPTAGTWKSWLAPWESERSPSGRDCTAHRWPTAPWALWRAERYG